MTLNVRLLWQLTLTSIALLVATPCRAQEKVTLQLKWQHSFQFAGYYAALQQGYYRAAGLDVDIRQGGADVDVAKVLRTARLTSGFARPASCLQSRRTRRLPSSA